MSEIKAGQIRKDGLGLYVITNVLFSCAIIYQNGEVREWSENWIKQDKLIAEYPTWQEAVNSEHFKND